MTEMSGLVGLNAWLHRRLSSFDLGTEVTLYTDLDCRKNISKSPENTGHPAARELAYQGLCRHHLTRFGRDRVGFRLQRGTDVARQPSSNVKTTSDQVFYGADDGNRTRVFSLGI